MKKHDDYQLDYPSVQGGILPTVNINELLEADRSDFYEGAIVYLRNQKARVERCDWPLVYYRIFNPHFREHQSREMCIPMLEDGTKYMLGPEKHRLYAPTLFKVDPSTRSKNLERKRAILTETPESDDSDDNLSGFSQSKWGNFRPSSFSNLHYSIRARSDRVNEFLGPS